MIAASFFHKYKRSAELILRQSDAEQYRQFHRANFVGFDRYLSEMSTNPQYQIARSRLWVDKTRKEACENLAEWMNGNEDPTGNEVENSRYLCSLCDSLDVLIRSQKKTPLWANIELKFFRNCVDQTLLQGRRVVFCRSDVIASSVARTLSMYIGKEYVPISQGEIMLAIMEKKLQVVWVIRKLADMGPEEAFLALYGKKDHGVSVFYSPLLLPVVLQSQNTVD